MGQRQWLGVVIAVVAVSGWGCSGTKAPGGTNTVSVNSAVGAASAASSVGEGPIVHFGTGDSVNADFSALEDAIHADPDGLQVVALRHLGDASETVHYAAVYALARTATTDEALKALDGLLASTRVDDRMLAAGALAYRGESSAIPVLIGELGSPDEMAFRDPPQTASGFARRQLLRFTAEDFGLRNASDAASALQAKPAWQQWWDQQGAALDVGLGG